MSVHTAWVRLVWAKVKRVPTRDLEVKMIRKKVFGNCSVGTSCMSKIRCLTFSIRICLHFDSRKPKNPSNAKLKGVVIFCHKIFSGIYFTTKSLRFTISCSRHSVHSEASTCGCNWKPKILPFKSH